MTSRERQIEHKQRRRERIAAARALGTHTAAEWESLKAEFGYRCLRCGREGYHLDKDHIIPVYQGGSDAIGNIQPLCAWCNAGKGPDATNWVELRRLERAAGMPHAFEQAKQR